MPINPGDKVILLDEIKTYGHMLPVHVNDTGLYVQGTGTVRHLIIAVYGYGNDWAAYEGWTRPDMEDVDAIDIVSRAGDKIWGESAKLLLKIQTKEVQAAFGKLYYRD